jgi:uncharacterized protein
MRPWFLASALAAVALWPGMAGAASPAFNCRYSISTVEHAICADPVASALDRELNALFRRAKFAAGRREARRLDAEEQAWLISRDRCGLMPHLDRRFIGCVRKAYARRISELRVWLRRLGEPDV